MSCPISLQSRMISFQVFRVVLLSRGCDEAACGLAPVGQVFELQHGTHVDREAEGASGFEHEHVGAAQAGWEVVVVRLREVVRIFVGGWKGNHVV